MEFTRSFESAGARFGSAGPLLVALYRGTTSPSMLDELDRAEGALLERFPRITTLTVIGQAGSVLKVDEGVRTRSVELGKKYEKRVIGSAIVVTTKGLSAVMVRTFLSGFFLLSKTETPMKTFSTIAEGLAWLQALPGQDLSIKTQAHAADIERFLA
ncbi:MAG: hypothetical protein Q8L48_39815 [Archangium sp.]|nr:hypothetical protein [Archangium sp.]